MSQTRRLSADVARAAPPDKGCWRDRCSGDFSELQNRAWRESECAGHGHGETACIALEEAMSGHIPCRSPAAARPQFPSWVWFNGCRSHHSPPEGWIISLRGSSFWAHLPLLSRWQVSLLPHTGPLPCMQGPRLHSQSLPWRDPSPPSPAAWPPSPQPKCCLCRRPAPTQDGRDLGAGWCWDLMPL